MHAAKTQKKQFKDKSGEERLWGQARGQFSASLEASTEPRGLLVLNPARSLIPRPGQGRGEGREGGGSCPQRAPTNLERGSNQVEQHR